MSDAEHELVVENDLLRAELLRVRGIAVRAVEAARVAQDTIEGKHDPWLDGAADDLTSEGVGRRTER
jgi:hypothetical protein